MYIKQIVHVVTFAAVNAKMKAEKQLHYDVEMYLSREK